MPAEPQQLDLSDQVKLEVSINSVRVSLAIQMKDDVEKMIGRKYMAFMMRRAETFQVLRKVPVEVSSYACILPRLIHSQCADAATQRCAMFAVCYLVPRTPLHHCICLLSKQRSPTCKFCPFCNTVA